MSNQIQFLFTFLFVTVAISNSAQDANFNQNDNAGIYNNPAFTGTNKSSSLDLNYRTRSPELSGNNQTMAFSANQYLGEGNGVSILYINDVFASAFFTNKIAIAYSKQITIKEKHHLSIGGQAAYFGRKISNPWLPSTQQTSGISLNTGILYHNEYFFSGLAVHNLLESDKGFFENNNPLRTYSMQAGGKISIQQFSFIPYVQGKVQGSFNQINLSLKTRFKKIEADLGYSVNNGPTGGVGVRFDKWNLGYNFGSSISNLNYGSTSAHEIRIGFQPTLFNKTNENYLDF